MRSKTICDSAIEDPAEKLLRDNADKDFAIRREELKKTHEYLTEWIPDALKSDALDPNERELLGRNEASLGETIRLLDCLLKGISSPVRRNEICYLMTEAIWSANVLGRFSPPINAIRKMEKIKHENWQAMVSREGKRSNDAQKAEKLREAILASGKPEALIASNKYAVSIYDDVRKHMQIKDGKWPSTRTIERTISAMLKERSKC